MSFLKSFRWAVSNALFICVAGLTSLIATPTRADFIALDSTRVSGNGAYTSSLGMDFDVLAPIIVTQLGAYDSFQDGLINPINVGIFDRNTQLLLISAVVISADTLIGLSRFSNIPDLALGVGQYSIVAQGFGYSDLHGNTYTASSELVNIPTINTGGGLINFVGSGRAESCVPADCINSLFYPTFPDLGPANRYDAGTFMFTAAIPEPEIYAMLGVGLGLLGWVGRRKKLKEACPAVVEAWSDR